MRLPRARHRWSLPPRQAIRLQRRLAGEIRHQQLICLPRHVAGGDVAFHPDGSRMIAGWVVWDINTETVVDTALAVRPVRFPYVPGLLSFREAPALIAAARKLEIEPDVFMLDGQGLAHPRRFGLACHIGLLIDRPSLGCAKTRLCGTPAAIEPPSTEDPHAERDSQTRNAQPKSPRPKSPRPWPGGTNEPERAPRSHSTPPAGLPLNRRGDSCPLMHEGEIIGRVLRTRAGVKPIYVSVGHKITLDAAVSLALRCCTKYRLPEPTRLAHQFVTQHRHDA
ncbi:MAG: endonuclease V [Phycisphaerae bacterium]|nr:endonuclease V [Phycisphaerae bacterium]